MSESRLRGSAGDRRSAFFVSLLSVLCVAVLTSWLLLPKRAIAEGENLPVATQQADNVARPSTTGQLSVTGAHLTDASGNNVVLRGVSTHGIQWYPQYVNNELFAQLSSEWNCNLVRLVVYSEDYCNGNQEQNLKVLHEGIEACIANDQYVLVDWHILNDNDPNIHIDEAKTFFAQISAEYASVPNVIYEICNEPNGETTWSQVHAYADEIIPIIRENSPGAVIIVGTPVYDRELMMASRDPLSFDNVMYTLHFYVASHHEDLQGELVSALEAGLPVFVTECGLSEASGDGRVDFDSAVSWFTLLAEHDVSYTIWSLSSKAETSAFIRPNVSDYNHLSDEDLTPVGLWVRSLIQGQDPRQIPYPELDENGQLLSDHPKYLDDLSNRDIRSAFSWRFLSLASILATLGFAISWVLYRRHAGRRVRTYDQLVGADGSKGRGWKGLVSFAVILLSMQLTLTYLLWRVLFSIPTEAGWLAIVGNVVLLVVEILGFVESLVHYSSMVLRHDHPLPQIDAADYPEVDIFISTYNEPCDLLRKTINGCVHLRYPDKSKVHIWLCDDNRRPQMRALAEEMGVGYFDRPDNKGAKAGNLNHAMGLTSAPYVVTLDADMIVRSDFLLKTIPYFVDAERHSEQLPEDQRVHLGLIQTPQAFYQPDVFQHALYSERRTTNEQDFFYRSIEVARTSTNSVIYGGSNTIISRKALEAIGGFFTESITEDFATGLLIESAGFVSLGLPEPLASGMTPDSYKEHVQQRTRWGRGVIVTARKLHLLTRKGLTFEQRLSYWGSLVYWYSPIKNLIYVLSPLMYSTFNVPVFACSWVDLLIYWLPMFAMQSICLRVVSGNAISTKWSGIHETSVMPHLLIPIIKESLGISLSTFKVTDKSGAGGKREADRKYMTPFIVLLLLSGIGIARVIWLFVKVHSVGLLVLLFWLVRNAYYLLMSLFLIDGRDSDGEPVCAIGAELVEITKLHGEGKGSVFSGVATVLNEHSMRVYLDEAEGLSFGDPVSVVVDSGMIQAVVRGAVVGIERSRSGKVTVYAIEILDYGSSELEYLQILYDRVPSLPQSLSYEFGIFEDLWRNVAFRIARTVE